MKKLGLLLIGMALALTVSFSVFAAGPARVNSQASQQTAKPGDEITVTVSLSDSDPFKSMALTPIYDKSAFEFVSATWFLTDAFIPGSFDPAKGNGAIGYQQEVTKSGNIFQYVLKVKDDAPFKAMSISTTAVIKNGAAVVESVSGESSVKIICKTHTFGEWSDGQNGNHIHTCTACGTVENETHKWDAGEVTKQPSCKEQGEKKFKCTVCGAEKTEAIAKNNNHSFGSYVQTKAPSCEAAGSESRTCSVCGAVQSRSIAALGHEFSDPIVTKEATCKESGIETGKCIRCGKEASNEIPKKEHEYGEWVVKVPATLTADGKQIKTCKNCGDVIEEKIPMIEDDPSSEEDPGSSAEPGPEDGNSGWILWIAMGILLLLVIIIIILLIQKKKKKKDNDDEKYVWKE